jgi:hypothetical protein
VSIVDAPDLDAAIAALAAALAPRLVAEMRDEAVTDVRAELAGRLAAELLRQCETELGLGRAERRDAVGTYVYGVVRSGVRMSREPVGIDPGAPVRLLESRGLAALVSEVPLAEFDEAGLRRNLRDAAWVERRARAHERVLEGALATTAVVPLRVCTVLVDDQQVIEMLGRDYGVLVDALERLTDRAEWRVQAFSPLGAIEREDLRRSVQRGEGDYDEGVSAGAEWAGEIYADLALFAEEALRNPLQARESNGRAGEMILNGVYLVDDQQASAFRSAARELAERYAGRGVEIVVTGPCPACNFVKSSIEAAR